MTVTADDPTEAVYLGIADEADLRTYLEGVDHERVQRVEAPFGGVRTRDMDGRAPTTPPTEADLWVGLLVAGLLGLVIGGVMVVAGAAGAGGAGTTPTAPGAVGGLRPASAHPVTLEARRRAGHRPDRAARARPSGAC